MLLIGMLDSPFVRRVAINMQLLGIDYEHQSLSVYSTYPQFKAINPLVKAPTLVCDDGVQLVDSTLIIDYLETLAGRSLMPSKPMARRRALRLLGLAFTACEKIGQTVQERELRPGDKQYAPWAGRLREQLMAAMTALESEVKEDEAFDQAGLMAAITWSFTQVHVPDMIAPGDFPTLAALAARAEKTPAFIATPLP